MPKLSLLLCVMLAGYSACAPNCGDIATISPRRITLQRWSTFTIVCSYHRPCLQVETWFLLREDQQSTDVLRDDNLSSVVTTRNASNGTVCSFEVDFSWSGSEDVRSELQSRDVHILLVMTNGTCQTDGVTIYFSNTWLNSSIEIYPTSELLIDPGGTGTVSCVAPCAIFSDAIESVVFNLFSIKDGMEKEINQTERRSLLSNYGFETSGGNCTSTVNLSYPEDEDIRRRLDAVRCTFIYTGFNRTVHRSHHVNIIFTDAATSTQHSTSESASSSFHSPQTDSDTDRNNSAAVFSTHTNQNIFIIAILLSLLPTVSI